MDAVLKKSIEELGNVAEQFKDVSERVGKLEAKGGAPEDLNEQLSRLGAAVSEADKVRASLDTVLQEKAADAKRISELEASNESVQAQLEEIARKSGRSVGIAGGNADVEAHRKGFDGFMRKGVEAGLSELQTKAVSVIVDAEGGYAVPETLELAIIEYERQYNPMRQIAGQMTVSNGSHKLPVSIGNAGSGWVAEKAARPETGTPTVMQLDVNLGEIYANPATTRIALEDMAIDVEQWLAQSVAMEFAERENAAFTSGDGQDKPKGILAYATSADSDKAGTRAFGVLQELTSGASGSLVADDLVALIHSTRNGYRLNSQFMMSNLSLAAVRTMKDADNNYLWRAGLEEGVPSTLLGYAVAENEDMPEITDGAGSKALVFGDFNRGYVVVDRLGTSVLRDDLTNKPYTHFYVTKRVGGLVRDSLALKVLAIAA